jgi:hypothetical protein
MTLYRLKKVGKHTYRKVQRNGMLGGAITLPKEVLPRAEQEAARTNGGPFLLDIPDAVRKGRPRYASAPRTR